MTNEEGNNFSSDRMTNNIIDPSISGTESKLTSKITVAMIVLIVSLTTSSYIYHFLRSGNLVEIWNSGLGLSIFVVLTVAPFLATYFLFRHFLSPLNKRLVTGSMSGYIHFAYKLLKITLVTNAIVLAAITSQLILSSQFFVGLTVISLQPSAIVVTLLFGFLSFKFISWFRSSRDWATLFLGAAFAMIAAGSVASDLATTVYFLSGDIYRAESRNSIAVSNSGNGDGSDRLKSDPMPHQVQLAINVLPRIAFVLYWAAAVMLLRNYARTIGKLVFWLLVSAPLATFLMVSIFIYTGTSSLLSRGIISQTAILVAGIFFGLIFFTIARRLGSPRTKPGEPSIKGVKREMTDAVYKHLVMTVFGTILFTLISIPPNHIIDWVHVPYPPFADVVWAFGGFAAFLYSFGLYFSAAAISRDSRLRRAIHKLATEEAKMLGSLGAAEMKGEIQKRIAKISEEQEDILEIQTGIQQEIPIEEIKLYADEVLKEIHRKS